MSFEFDSNFDTGVNIKVIGVGGGGGNAVNRMIESNIQGVDFISVNCDKQILLKSSAPTKISIGDKITRGPGAGGDPSVGEQAAEESIEDIDEAEFSVIDLLKTAGIPYQTEILSRINYERFNEWDGRYDTYYVISIPEKYIEKLRNELTKK